MSEQADASSNEASSENTVEPSDESESDGLVAAAKQHPIATGTLVASVIIGAVLGYVYLGEDFGTTRRILGGALAGGGSWLLVMVGRII